MNLPNEVRAAIDILVSNGHQCYLVGGCVRDTVMGKEPSDYDLTTSALPEQIKQCFKAHHCITAGEKHGTVAPVINGSCIEITTFRIDGEYNDSRHPNKVEFSLDIKDDLARRDFTVNAIACTPNGSITDPFCGIDDIKNRIIRCVGDPYKRFKEDALRILRAIRFASVLDFEIEEQTANAIHALKDNLKNIAKERIFTEFLKLICGKNVKKILADYYDVIAVFIPELLPAVGFEQNNIHHCYDVFTHTLVSMESIEPDPILRLSMFFHDLGKPASYSEDERGGHFHGHYKISAEIAQSVLTRLRASNELAERVVLLVYRHDALIPETDRSIKRLVAKVGEENTRLLFKINRADAMAQAKFQIKERLERTDLLEARLNEIMSAGECIQKKSMNINGNDLIALGIPRGKRIGEVLDILFNEVVEEKLENSKDLLIKRALELK